MNRHTFFLVLSILLCSALVVFVSLCSSSRTKYSATNIALTLTGLDTSATDQPSDVNVISAFPLKAIEMPIIVHRLPVSPNGESIPLVDGSVGFRERMLKRAAFLERAVDSLEKGPPTPSWSWEKIKEGDTEDPLLQQDAAAVRASTSQEVDTLLRRNLAEADAELQSENNAEHRASSHFLNYATRPSPNLIRVRNASAVTAHAPDCVLPPPALTQTQQ